MNMSTVGSTYPTLANVANRVDPQGRIAAVAELLSEQNEVIQDMPWVEANQMSGHVSVIRTGLPTPAWRALNYGVAASKSTTAKVTDTVGSLEAYSIVDQKVAEMNGNTAEFRASEDKAFIEGMGQEFSDALFYGNVMTDEKKFHGLTPRFSLTTAGNGGQVIKGSSNDSDNASIWLIGWGDNTVHGIYPKGSQAGLKVDNRGQQTRSDGAGGFYEAFVTHYRWECGLVVKDWRFVCRIANIEVSDLVAAATSGDNLYDLMCQALDKIHNLSACRPVFYMNRTCKGMLRRQLSGKGNVFYTANDPVCGTVDMFEKVPVRICDSLVSTETAIS
jgi:hypothetical protein